MPVSTPNHPLLKPPRRDAHNRRVRKVVAYGGVENSSEVRNGTTDFAYQGWRVLWENFTPEVMPFAPTGGPTTFVYGNYLDEVWNAMEIDGAEIIENYYFLTGVNYSVMGVIDALGGNALAEAYEYDPYGRHRVIDPGTDTTYFTSDDTYDELHPGAINNAIRTTGQRFDAESGLMYYKNRYYDPAAGRFIGRDPLGWDEGPNRYGYVGGMPTMAVDPEGLVRVSLSIKDYLCCQESLDAMRFAPADIADPLIKELEFIEKIFGPCIGPPTRSQFERGVVEECFQQRGRHRQTGCGDHSSFACGGPGGSGEGWIKECFREKVGREPKSFDVSSRSYPLPNLMVGVAWMHADCLLVFEDGIDCKIHGNYLNSGQYECGPSGAYGYPHAFSTVDDQLESWLWLWQGLRDCSSNIAIFGAPGVF